jgi:hypothetical protein
MNKEFDFELQTPEISEKPLHLVHLMMGEEGKKEFLENYEIGENGLMDMLCTYLKTHKLDH